MVRRADFEHDVNVNLLPLIPVSVNCVNQNSASLFGVISAYRDHKLGELGGIAGALAAAVRHLQAAE